MLPQLFSVPTDIDEGKSQTYQPLKGVIVGAGQVGMSSAYSMLIQNVLDEMLVIDVDRQKAEGEVMDLNHIIDRKGATYYAIGLGVTQIAKAILRDQHRVFTVSNLIEGLHDIEDVCLSLPAVVSRQGVTRVLNLALSDTEKKQLQNSAKVMRENIDKLDL
ncbi:MAG: lactate/malate family dehydrogenase [Limnospira sp.]